VQGEIPKLSRDPRLSKLASHFYGNPSLDRSVMLREILWQEPGYFDCDEPDKLHHTATLVSQNMTGSTYVPVKSTNCGESGPCRAPPGR
jgi:hypothetical protein